MAQRQNWRPHGNQTNSAKLPNSYIFQPIALENVGAINELATSFITELGRNISVKSNDQRKSTFCNSSAF